MEVVPVAKRKSREDMAVVKSPLLEDAQLQWIRNASGLLADNNLSQHCVAK